MSMPRQTEADMLGKFANWLHQKERALHRSMGNDVTDPDERKRSWRHYLWLDHGILRYWWTNFDEIAPDVYRSNHPHHARFAAFKEMGVKSILNLRGTVQKSPYLFEVESCAQLGLTLVDVPLGAREFPKQDRLLLLLDTFETIQKPFVMHCKSGADRTGLAAALYLLIYTDADDTAVRRQLSFRYIHIRKSATGRLDFLLEAYFTARDATGISIRDWAATIYDRDAMASDYTDMKSQERFWRGW